MSIDYYTLELLIVVIVCVIFRCCIHFCGFIEIIVYRDVHTHMIDTHAYTYRLRLLRTTPASLGHEPIGAPGSRLGTIGCHWLLFEQFTIGVAPVVLFHSFVLLSCNVAELLSCGVPTSVSSHQAARSYKMGWADSRMDTKYHMFIFNTRVQRRAASAVPDVPGTEASFLTPVPHLGMLMLCVCFC